MYFVALSAQLLYTARVSYAPPMFRLVLVG